MSNYFFLFPWFLIGTSHWKYVALNFIRKPPPKCLVLSDHPEILVLSEHLTPLFPETLVLSAH